MTEQLHDLDNQVRGGAPAPSGSLMGVTVETRELDVRARRRLIRRYTERVTDESPSITWQMPRSYRQVSNEATGRVSEVEIEHEWRNGAWGTNVTFVVRPLKKDGTLSVRRSGSLMFHADDVLKRVTEMPDDMRQWIVDNLEPTTTLTYSELPL